MTPKNFFKASLLAVTLLGSAATFADIGANANGTPVSDGAKITRQETITPQTKSLNASHGEVVRFILADGKQFSWKFNGASGNYVNLSDIAPKGSVNQDVRIYTGHPYDSSNNSNIVE